MTIRAWMYGRIVPVLRRYYNWRVAKDLTLVQPIDPKPMMEIYKWFRDNPGMAFYFGIKGE